MKPNSIDFIEVISETTATGEHSLLSHYQGEHQNEIIVPSLHLEKDSKPTIIPVANPSSVEIVLEEGYVIGNIVNRESKDHMTSNMDSLGKIQNKILSSNTELEDSSPEQEKTIHRLVRETQAETKLQVRKRVQDILRNKIYSGNVGENTHQEARKKLCNLVREFTNPRTMDDQDDHQIMTIDTNKVTTQNLQLSTVHKVTHDIEQQLTDRLSEEQVRRLKRAEYVILSNQNDPLEQTIKIEELCISKNIQTGDQLQQDTSEKSLTNHTSEVEMAAQGPNNHLRTERAKEITTSQNKESEADNTSALSPVESDTENNKNQNEHCMETGTEATIIGVATDIEIPSQVESKETNSKSSNYMSTPLDHQKGTGDLTHDTRKDSPMEIQPETIRQEPIEQQILTICTNAADDGRAEFHNGEISVGLNDFTLNENRTATLTRNFLHLPLDSLNEIASAVADMIQTDDELSEEEEETWGSEPINRPTDQDQRMDEDQSKAEEQPGHSDDPHVLPLTRPEKRKRLEEDQPEPGDENIQDELLIEKRQASCCSTQSVIDIVKKGTQPEPHEIRSEPDYVKNLILNQENLFLENGTGCTNSVVT